MNLRTAFIRIAHENPETRTTLLPLVKQADKWETLPKGWTDESLKKFWDKITGDVKHKVTKCIKEMEGKFDDPGAFCASLADRVDPGWRSRTAMEHTSPEALKEYLKEHPNADPKNHTVKKAPEKAETSGGEGWKSDPKVQKASKEREKAEKELKEFDEIFPKQKAELDKLTPEFEKLREKAYARGYIGSDSGELSKNDIKRLKEFSVDSEDLVSDYLFLKKEVAKGPPPKGARDLIVERIQKATEEEEEAIEAYEEEAANASYERAMAEAKPKAKPAPKKEGPENKQASLRARVIRLAHTRPELRAALLPLL